MKRIALVALSLLSAVSLIGMCVLNYFATTRMGMIRWLNHQNRNLESVVNIDAIKVALLLVALILAIALIYLIFKNKQNLKPSDLLAVLLNFIILVAFLYVALMLSTSIMKIYYFALLLTFLATSSLSLRNILSIKL